MFETMTFEQLQQQYDDYAEQLIDFEAKIDGMFVSQNKKTGFKYKYVAAYDTRDAAKTGKLTCFVYLLGEKTIYLTGDDIETFINGYQENLELLREIESIKREMKSIRIRHRNIHQPN